MESNAWNISLAVLVVFVISRVQKLFKGIRATGNIPGFRVPFQPYAIPGALFKTSWWNPGLECVWHWRRFMYKRFNNNTISLVPFLIGQPAILSANLMVVKQILSGSNKSAFIKPSQEELGPVSYWGTNLLVSEGDIWKKHRRIVHPAFSQKLYELVWSETLDLFKQMVSAEGFEEEKSIQFSAIQEITAKFTLYIIGRCGFDFPFHWKEKTDEIDGGVSFPEAMRFFLDNIQLLHLPQSLLTLPFAKFKKLNRYIDGIRKFMENKIGEKEKLIANQQLGDDIFSMLVQANLAEKDSKLKLDYSELISDAFLMLFAGHETTGHTMAATIACLAMFPDQQEEVVNQILTVVGTERDPTFSDYPKLNRVQAAFYEALRMFPPVYVTSRNAKEDTTLNVPNSANVDEYTPVPILKGTQMVVDIVGLYRDPQYFEDPEVYRIARWYNIPNEAEAVLGFGLGQRACIGRKFALTEAVCFLTMLIRDWKVEPLLNPGESVDEWFEKFSTECIAIVTFNLGKIPVRFVHRS